MKKRVLGLFLFSLLIISLLSFNVSASFEDDINRYVEDYVSPVASLLFGGFEGENAGELLFVKILFFIIIFSVIYYAVKRIPNIGDNNLTLWGITVACSLIAIRYFSDPKLIEFLWLPQGVLGVTFATLLPFVIFFFFVQSFGSSIIRKTSWAAFAVIYFMLALLRWDSLKTDASFPIESIANLGWFYLAIAVLAIILILGDKAIHSVWIRQELQKNKQRRNTLRKLKLQDKIAEWEGVIANENSTDKEKKDAKKEIKKLQNRIAVLYD